MPVMGLIWSLANAHRIASTGEVRAPAERHAYSYGHHRRFRTPIRVQCCRDELKLRPFMRDMALLTECQASYVDLGL